ncbi:MAG TPA: hypothetical protein VMJ10_05805 [Kofleriaceae bacterium]|nr:hypothetical protein [Kofleriaceae bacterium]
MIRFLLFLALAAAIGYCGATVPLGNKTLFGHIRAIWHSPETQDLKNGVQETAGPTMHRVERGIEQGYKAMKEPEDAGVGAAGSGSAH